MARARNIKPGFFANDLLGELEPLARLLFIGLWTVADRSGRLEERPKKLKATLLPYDDCSVESLLSGLEKSGFVVRYSVEGSAYIQIVNFEKHQNPHKNEGESSIPAPEDSRAIPEKSREVPEQHQSNPADSLLLIPDSGFRIADSGLPDSRREASPAKRRRQLPDDFVLTPERRAVLLEANPNHPNPGGEFEQFIDHHRSRGNVMADWDAAWRTWARNSVRFAARPVRQGSLLEHNLAAMQEFVASGTE